MLCVWVFWVSIWYENVTFCWDKKRHERHKMSEYKSIVVVVAIVDSVYVINVNLSILSNRLVMCETQQQQQTRDNNNSVSSRSIMNLSSTFTIMHDVKIYELLRHFNIWFDIKRAFGTLWMSLTKRFTASAVRVSECLKCDALNS